MIIVMFTCVDTEHHKDASFVCNILRLRQSRRVVPSIQELRYTHPDVNFNENFSIIPIISSNEISYEDT